MSTAQRTGGVVCQHCDERVPLVDIGEHLIGHESIVDEDHIPEAMAGPNRSSISEAWESPSRRERRSAAMAKSEARLHDPEGIGHGIRVRPWSVPS